MKRAKNLAISVRNTFLKKISNDKNYIFHSTIENNENKWKANDSVAEKIFNLRNELNIIPSEINEKKFRQNKNKLKILNKCVDFYNNYQKPFKLKKGLKKKSIFK